MGSFPNTTPLRIGMEATAGGKKFRLVARLVMGVVEEGQTYYWDEFLLQAADGDFFFIELDEGQWRRLKVVRPSRPFPMTEAAQYRVGQTIQIKGGQRATVSKVDTATLHHIEGQPNWDARVGERVRYLDAHAYNQLFVLEWEPDGTITAYHGVPLAKRQLLQMFGLHEQIAALDHAGQAAGRRAMFGAVCLGMALLAFILASTFKSNTAGRSVSRAAATIPSPPPTAPAGSPLSIRYPPTFASPYGTPPPSGEVRFGPIRLEPGANAHRLVVYSNALADGREVTAELRPAASPTPGTNARPTTGPAATAAARTAVAAAAGGKAVAVIDPANPVSTAEPTAMEANAADDFRVSRAATYELHVTGPASHLVGYDIRGGVSYPVWLTAYAIAAACVGVVFLLFAWGTNAMK